MTSAAPDPVRPSRDEIAAMDLASLHELRKATTKRIVALARAIAAAAAGNAPPESGADAGNSERRPAAAEDSVPVKEKRKPAARPLRIRGDARSSAPDRPKAWELAVMEADRVLDGIDVKAEGIRALMLAKKPLTTRQVAERVLKAADRTAGQLALRGVARKLSIILFHLSEHGHVEKSGSSGRSTWKARQSLADLARGRRGR